MTIYQVKVNYETLFIATDKSIGDWVKKYYNKEFKAYEVPLYNFGIPKYHYKLVYEGSYGVNIQLIATDKYIYDLTPIINAIFKYEVIDHYDDIIYVLSNGTKVYAHNVNIIIY